MDFIMTSRINATPDTMTPPVSLSTCAKNSVVFFHKGFSDHRVVKKTFEFLGEYSKFHEMAIAIINQLSILTRSYHIPKASFNTTVVTPIQILAG